MERIALAAPKVIVDLGCGVGNVTRLLADRWPDAQITGVDSSPTMLAEARRHGGNIRWVEADLATWTADEPAELLFSNATLHWLDNHPRLFPRLLNQLRPGGILAVQMPRNFEEPSHQAITETIEAGPWRDQLLCRWRRCPVASPADYLNMLLPLTSSLDVWEAVYFHILEGENPVVAWTGEATLRPLLATLEEVERRAFLADYSARIARAYPRRIDGKTLFPFRRLFIVATR